MATVKTATTESIAVEPNLQATNVCIFPQIDTFQIEALADGGLPVR